MRRTAPKQAVVVCLVRIVGLERLAPEPRGAVPETTSHRRLIECTQQTHKGGEHRGAMNETRNRIARRTRATQSIVVAGAVLASAGIAGGLIGQAVVSGTAAGTQSSTTDNQSFNGSVTSQSSGGQTSQATTQGS